MNWKNGLVPLRTKKAVFTNYLESLAEGTEFNITSLPKVNRLLRGMERQKLIIIGARPSEGKTAFMMQLAWDLSLGKKVVIVSLETTYEEAMLRLYCHSQKVPNTSVFENAKACSTTKFYKQLDEEKRQLVFIEQFGMTVKEISELMEEIKDNKPDILFLDYLQCIKGQRKLEVLDDYIISLRNLAIQQNICIVLCSQINRMNISDNKEPNMLGLKGSGVIEESADKIIILHYPCKLNRGESNNKKFRVFIDKNKNGMTGYVDIKFEPDIYTFSEEIETKDKLDSPANFQETQDQWET